MQVENTLLSMEENIANAEAVKDVVLSKLLKDEKISEDDYNTYKSEYGIIIFKKSWYKRLFEKGEWVFNIAKLK